jgi:hypothetical protein
MDGMDREFVRTARVVRNGVTLVERVSETRLADPRARLSMRADGAGFDRYRTHVIVRRQEAAPRPAPVPAAPPQPRVLTAPQGLTPSDVEQLIGWAIRVEKIVQVVTHGVGLHDLEAACDGVEPARYSADGIRRVQVIGELGTEVSQSGWRADRAHPDAELVWRAIDMLPADRKRLVTQHARQNDRPELPERPCLKPARAQWNHVLETWERVGVDYDRSWDKGRNWGACPLVWRPSPAEIEGRRMLYGMWRRALFTVAERLRAWHDSGSERFVRWYPTDPQAPAMPWVDITQAP